MKIKYVAFKNSLDFENWQEDKEISTGYPVKIISVTPLLSGINFDFKDTDATATSELSVFVVYNE